MTTNFFSVFSMCYLTQISSAELGTSQGSSCVSHFFMRVKPARLAFEIFVLHVYYFSFFTKLENPQQNDSIWNDYNVVKCYHLIWHDHVFCQASDCFERNHHFLKSLFAELKHRLLSNIPQKRQSNRTVFKIPLFHQNSLKNVAIPTCVLYLQNFLFACSEIGRSGRFPSPAGGVGRPAALRVVSVQSNRRVGRLAAGAEGARDLSGRC